MNKQILALAIPSIVANITTPLLGLIDTAIVGHMGSAVFLAAIAVGGSAFSLLYWCFAFLRMGSSGLTAQAFGADDKKAQSLVLYRSLAVALAAGMAMTILGYPIAKGVLAFMGVTGETESLAMSYVTITIWGAPAVLGMYALSGWFLGMQNSRFTMWTSIAINLLNIAVSLTLVYVAGWEIAGVATGTAVAQWGGFLLGLVLLAVSYSPRFPGWREVMKLDGLKRFFSINLDIFLRTLCLVAVTLWFTRAGASQGEVMLAVNTLLMQLFILFSYMMDGFAFAGEALVGRYIGERNGVELRRCIRSLFNWAVSMAALFTLVYAVGGEGFLSLLSSDGDVISKTDEYVWWAVAVPLAGCAAFTWDGVFIGATLTRDMLLSMVAALVAFFSIYIALFDSMGNHALWMAFLIYLIIRGVVLSIRARDFLKSGNFAKRNNMD